MKYLIFYIIISFINSIASYFLTNNLWFALIVFTAFILSLLIYDLKTKKGNDLYKAKSKDLTTFIHDFIYFYYSSNNIDESIKCCANNLSNSFKEELGTYKEYTSIELLENLSHYFKSNLYELFLKTMRIVYKNNLDIIDNSKFILLENNRHIKNHEIKESIKSKYLIIYTFLTSFSYLTLIIFRFSVNNYFLQIKSNVIYLISVSLFFVFLLVGNLVLLIIIKGGYKTNYDD